MTRRPVAEDISSYLPATLELAIITAMLVIVFGIVLGSRIHKISRANGLTES